MILPSHEPSYLQVGYPIVDPPDDPSAERFLSRVLDWGNVILGERMIASRHSLREEKREDGSVEDVDVEEPVTDPRLEVAQVNDFEMLLLHFGVPNEQASRYKLNHLYSELTADSIEEHGKLQRRNGSFGRAKRRIPGLIEHLNRIAAGAEDVGVQPDELNVHCDRICEIPQLDGSVVLGLSPSDEDVPGLVLTEQSKVSWEHLNRVSGDMISGDLPGYGVTAPFARLPKDIADDEYNLLMIELTKIADVRITMSGLAFACVNRPKTRR